MERLTYTSLALLLMAYIHILVSPATVNATNSSSVTLVANKTANITTSALEPVQPSTLSIKTLLTTSAASASGHSPSMTTTVTSSMISPNSSSVTVEKISTTGTPSTSSSVMKTQTSSLSTSKATTSLVSTSSSSATPSPSGSPTSTSPTTSMTANTFSTGNHLMTSVLTPSMQQQTTSTSPTTSHVASAASAISDASSIHIFLQSSTPGTNQFSVSMETFLSSASQSAHILLPSASNVMPSRSSSTSASSTVTPNPNPSSTFSTCQNNDDICKNGGTCYINGAKTKICICKGDYYGTMCEKEANPLYKPLVYAFGGATGFLLLVICIALLISCKKRESYNTSSSKDLDNFNNIGLRAKGQVNDGMIIE